MKNFSLLILFVFISLTAFCQAPISPEFQELWDDFHFYKSKEGTSEITYKGSPFFEVEDNSCALTLLSNQEISGLTIRYNIYKDQMEIKKDDQYYVISKQKALPHIKLGSKHFFYTIYNDGNFKKTGYLEFLTGGVCTLFRQHGKVLIAAKQPKPFQEATPPTFRDKASVYYISIDNAYPTRVKNFKEIISLLSPHSDAMTAYIKSNKLKFKKQEDLEKVIEFYNSL